MSIPAITSPSAMGIAAPQSPVIRPDTGTQTGTPKAIEQSTSAAPAGDAVRGTRETPKDTQPPSPADLQQALKEVQTAISGVTNDLRFSIDEDTGRTLIKIVDRETDEVIKQIPSEEFLRISRALDKFQGLLVKQEV